MQDAAVAVETAVWARAFELYPSAKLREVIHHGCTTRQRRRGDPGRLHASEVTEQAVMMVREIMTALRVASELPSDPPRYIPIRST